MEPHDQRVRDVPEVGLLDGEEVIETVRLADIEPSTAHYPAGTFRKIGSGIASLLAAVLATYLVPALEFARPWTSDDPRLFWNLTRQTSAADDAVREDVAAGVEAAERLARRDELEEREAEPIADRAVVAAPSQERLPAYQSHPDDAEAVPRSLEMAEPNALDGYFAALARTDAGYAGAITRAIHWGDSVIANDNVTSTLREKMQRRFGDAGHGFHLLAKPNASYRHKAIRFFGGKTWSRCYIINHCKRDGFYGLGATTVWSAGGAKSGFATVSDAPNGRKVTRFEVWYAAQPAGGEIQVEIDDERMPPVSTRAEALTDRWERFEVEDGPHKFEVRAGGRGRVRLYGVVLERDGPGVVWDGMEQQGAFTSRMLYFDPDHIRRQVEHRDPDLLVFEFGGNDLLLGARRLARYKQDFAAVLRLFRGADDPPACLVISPVDHGDRRARRIESDPMVPKITDVQREVALAEGCAFFDTLAAMGGDGGVARWRHSKPPLISGDLAHPTQAGQRVLGHMVYVALMEAYRGYRARTDAPPSGR